LFVQNNFGNFYSNLFQHQWDLEGKSVAMLEYAWDVSPKNYVKCDPCVATAPSTQDLVQAGVWWISRDWNDYNDAHMTMTTQQTSISPACTYDIIAELFHKTWCFSLHLIQKISRHATLSHILQAGTLIVKQEKNTSPI
jgi:hypothetical protein